MDKDKPKKLSPTEKRLEEKTIYYDKLEAAKYIEQHPNMSEGLKQIFQSIIDKEK